MNDTNQKKLGQTLWNIADQLRGAMDADDFRDYMLSFLFLRYLSDNYETAAKKELGKDYPAFDGLIAAQTQQIEALKTRKKGLMQQLFPSPRATGATQMSPLRPEAVGA